MRGEGNLRRDDEACIENRTVQTFKCGDPNISAHRDDTQVSEGFVTVAVAFAVAVGLVDAHVPGAAGALGYKQGFRT